MKYLDSQYLFSLQMIFTGYYEAGTEWCYQNVVSPFTRIFLVDEGEAYVYMDKKEYRLRKGDLFIVPKNTFHTYRCNDYMNHYYICFFDQFIGGNSVFDYIGFNYQIKARKLDFYLMKRYLQLNPNYQILVPDPQIYDNKPSLLELNRERPLNELCSDIESNGILLQLFSRFIHVYAYSSCDKQRSFRGMNTVLNYVDNHLGDTIYVKDLSDIMCVTPDYFTRVFKKINGMSPARYIQLKRIERAQTLICHSDLSLKEIAEEVGIHNQSQFSKLFHKFTGVSPQKYKELKI